MAKHWRASETCKHMYLVMKQDLFALWCFVWVKKELQKMEKNEVQRQQQWKGAKWNIKIHNFEDYFHTHNTRKIGTTSRHDNLCTNAPCTWWIRIKFGRYTLNIRGGYLILLVLIQATGWTIRFSDFFCCTSRPPPKWPRGLRHGSACWDCGFESRQGNGCLSHVSVVCCRLCIILRAYCHRENNAGGSFSLNINSKYVYGS